MSGPSWEIHQAIVAQARAEERARYAQLREFVENVATSSEWTAGWMRFQARRMLGMPDEGPWEEEAARVARVIAEVRANDPSPVMQWTYREGWRAACDAIEARLEGGSDAG